MPTTESAKDGNGIEELVCLRECSPKIKESIKSIIENNGYEEYTLEFRCATTNGGLLGQTYEVNIKGNAGHKEKETNLFIKESLEMEKIDTLRMEELYANEVFIYTNYATVINKLQDEAGIPEYDKYKFVNAYEGTNEEMIILENLSKQGFKTYYRMDIMSIEFAKLGVEKLAKFHALSFAVENKFPNYFNSHVKPRKTPYHFDDDWRALVNKISVKTADMFDGSEKQKILNFETVFKTNFPKHFKARDDIKCCLVHGDYRLSNILVREVDGLPVEVMPVDYQLIMYGNPIIDFIYFVFLGTDREFRKRHLDDLIDLYYNTLTRFLVYFDLDVVNIYPREVYDKIYQESLEFGLIVGLYSSMFVFIQDNADIGMRNKSIAELLFDPHPKYKGRVRELIEEFTAWGYL